MDGAKAYQMVMRYFKLNGWIKDWHTIYDFKTAFPDV